MHTVGWEEQITLTLHEICTDTKLKQKLFDLDDEKLKPYFKLENVNRSQLVIVFFSSLVL